MADEYKRTCDECGGSNPRAATFCAWCGVRTRDPGPFEDADVSYSPCESDTDPAESGQ